MSDEWIDDLEFLNKLSIPDSLKDLPIVGNDFSQLDGKTAYKLGRSNDLCFLKCAPSNPSDTNAIEVLFLITDVSQKPIKVGHIARTDAANATNFLKNHGFYQHDELLVCTLKIKGTKYYARPAYVISINDILKINELYHTNPKFRTDIYNLTG